MFLAGFIKEVGYLMQQQRDIDPLDLVADKAGPETLQIEDIIDQFTQTFTLA